jgi:hypothetical protein
MANKEEDAWDPLESRHKGPIRKKTESADSKIVCSDPITLTLTHLTLAA